MNKEIREAIRKSGLRHWQVAALMGVSEATLVRWLRSELSDDKRVKILQAIETAAKGGA